MKRTTKPEQPPKAKNFGACVPADLHARATEFARAQDLSLSQLIRRALVKFMEAK